MTLFISIFSILMVILANHPSNSGALPKSNLQEEVLTELRLQRSLADRSKKPQKSAKNQQKNQERKSKRKGHKSAARPGKRAFDPNFEFRACDYLDLVEVGYRQNSDSNCSPGDKFIFKVLCLKLTNSTHTTLSILIVTIVWINE